MSLLPQKKPLYLEPDPNALWVFDSNLQGANPQLSNLNASKGLTQPQNLNIAQSTPIFKPKNNPPEVIKSDMGKVAPEIQKLYSGFAGGLALQAGITPEQAETSKPIGRLATAGLLANLALPSKGIGMISEALPGSRGISDLTKSAIKKVTKNLQAKAIAIASDIGKIPEKQSIKQVENFVKKYGLVDKQQLDDYIIESYKSGFGKTIKTVKTKDGRFVDYIENNKTFKSIVAKDLKNLKNNLNTEVDLYDNLNLKNKYDKAILEIKYAGLDQANLGLAQTVEGLDEIGDLSLKKEAFQKFSDNLSVARQSPNYNIIKNNEILDYFNKYGNKNYKSWEDIPEFIDIYRGTIKKKALNTHTINGKKYQNFTLSKETAKDFSETGVLHWKINKNDIDWITNDIGEAEVILENPRKKLINIQPKFGIPSNKPILPTYQGETDLTTKLLEKLKGRTEVSKQFISDLTNAPDLKQVEKDVIRNVLETQPDKIPVQDFANKVKAELLPLERKVVGETNASAGLDMSKYESISLPSGIRGNVRDYTEHIYESPIKTSAGQTHFGGESDNYFGHTRVEDMADKQTRRVIEVQSDLYQKGNLEKEVEKGWSSLDEAVKHLQSQYPGKSDEDALRMAELSFENQGGSVKKLQQYNDPTAHFRMVREEVKQAAIDGKTKLQFPTGETAMKIEGLGERGADRFGIINSRTGGADYIINGQPALKPENLKVGMEIAQQTGATGMDKWIITDVLGDGKFRAIIKQQVNLIEAKWHKPISELLSDEKKAVKNLYDISGFKETFDISGKVDTNNPIYKFYEKDLGRYLTSKYQAKQVVDKQGVKWYEIDIKPEQSKLPVEAFGLGALFKPRNSKAEQEKQQRINTNWEEAMKMPAEREKLYNSIPDKKDVIKKLSGWTSGEASYYNPEDPNQTRVGKSSTDLTGAYGRDVLQGSVAFGNRYFQDDLKAGKKIYLQIKGFENVKTPYGMGIFRIDDTMNRERYNKKGKFNIDFHPKDLSQAQILRGRFPIEFKIVKIE